MILQQSADLILCLKNVVTVTPGSIINPPPGMFDSNGLQTCNFVFLSDLVQRLSCLAQIAFVFIPMPLTSVVVC